jgi:hypothetical protein
LGKFVLEIELGNDAMQAGFDIANALRKIADDIEGNMVDETTTYESTYPEPVFDLNGNRVGFYKVEN